MSIVPTILVGLGGIGSAVVENIYQQIPQNNRDLIAVHAFDTNINDIANRPSLKGNITQISKPLTVGQCLNSTNPSVRDWFPDNHHELRRKTMTDGAGQLRAVSRLAYYTAIEDGKLNGLESSLSRIFRAEGSEFEGSVRVVIVSSLAGGTGAGTFLQAALFIREVLKRNYNRESVVVRGAFLLPDTLVKTQTIDKEEWDNLRANGYACMKELNAFISSGDKTSATIELEYRPDQVDVDGRQAHAILAGYLPYDYCFLYDFENTKSENLGDFTQYMKQISKTIFLQVFSPISENNHSEEDNMLLKLVEKDSLNRFCGAGVSTLCYPYEDIVEYCALSWAHESIEGQWCRLDDDFEAELRRYERDLNSGAFGAKPEIGKRYISLLDNYARGERPHPFFTQIYMSTRLLNEHGQEVDAKAEQFIAGVQSKITQVQQNDHDFVQAFDDCKIDENKLKRKELAQSEIRRMETHLDILKQKVFKTIDEHKVFIGNQVIGDDPRVAEGLVGDEDFRLYTWILKRSEPLHPVAVRYMLYQIEQILDKKIAELTSLNTKSEHAIKGYESKFDDPETPDRVETAEQRVNQALNAGFFGRAFNNKFKNFVDLYMDEALAQAQLLKLYRERKLQEVVFVELRKSISNLLNVWEEFFRSLRSVNYGLLDDKNRRAVQHDNDSDPTVKFVLAGKDEKEKMWDEMRTSLVLGNDLPAEISQQIYIGQFGLFYDRFCNLGGVRRSALSIDEMFRTDVLGWYRQKLLNNSDLNMNVVEAVKRKIQQGTDATQTSLEEVFKKQDRLAKPFIPAIAKRVSEKHYWGINPECLNGLTGSEIDACFEARTRVIDNKAFSPYEVVCYRAHYGLMASDFPKFQPGEGMNPGAYFQSYFKRIRQLDEVPCRTITPHLDKRWHLSAYMRDINPAQAKADLKRQERAFVLALIHGRASKCTLDNQNTWEYFIGPNRKSIFVGKRLIEDTNYSLYKAMSFNPSLVDAIIDWGEKDLANSKKEQIETHSFYAGCLKPPGLEGTIVDNILGLINEAQDENLQPLSEHLLNLALEEITDYFVTVLGQHRERTAQQNSLHFIDQVLANSSVYKDAGAGGNAYAFSGWKHVVDTYRSQLMAN